MTKCSSANGASTFNMTVCYGYYIYPVALNSCHTRKCKLTSVLFLYDVALLSLQYSPKLCSTLQCQVSILAWVINALTLFVFAGRAGELAGKPATLKAMLCMRLKSLGIWGAGRFV